MKSIKGVVPAPRNPVVRALLTGEWNTRPKVQMSRKKKTDTSWKREMYA